MKIAFEWLKSNCLVVINNKTENIVFSLDYKIFNNVKHVKLLGLFDRRLSWHFHIVTYVPNLL